LIQLGFDQAAVLKEGIYFTGETKVAKIVHYGEPSFGVRMVSIRVARTSTAALL